MRVSDAKLFIKGLIQKGVHVPPLLVGSMGIGKSQIVKQVAEELGINLVDLRLAQQEPGDLIGIPHYDEKTGTTVYARPNWFPVEGTKGILFLDELNRAPNDVRQAVFQLVLDGRMHTHVLPKDWFVVAAINPENGAYQVETLDPAMIRRFCAIALSPDVETWLNWALGKGQIMQDLTGFVSANKGLLYVNEEFSIDTKPTPDQYRMLNDMMKVKAVPRELEIEVFTGLIGKEAAIALRKWLDSNKTRPVSGEDVLLNYAKVQEKVKKQRNDEMYATVHELVALMENHKKPKKAELENLKNFILDISSEFQATVIKRLPKDYLTEIVGFDEVTETITRVMKEAQK